MAQPAYTLGQYLLALTDLEHVTARLAEQFHKGMTPEEACANLDARAIVLKHRIHTHNEAAKFHSIDDLPITQADVDSWAMAGREAYRG